MWCDADAVGGMLEQEPADPERLVERAGLAVGDAMRCAGARVVGRQPSFPHADAGALLTFPRGRELPRRHCAVRLGARDAAGLPLPLVERLVVFLPQRTAQRPQLSAGRPVEVRFGERLLDLVDAGPQLARLRVDVQHPADAFGHLIDCDRIRQRLEQLGPDVLERALRPYAQPIGHLGEVLLLVGERAGRVGTPGLLKRFTERDRHRRQDLVFELVLPRAPRALHCGVDGDVGVRGRRGHRRVTGGGDVAGESEFLKQGDAHFVEPRADRGQGGGVDAAFAAPQQPLLLCAFGRDVTHYASSSSRYRSARSGMRCCSIRSRVYCSHTCS